MKIFPTEIKRLEGRGVSIAWSDAKESVITCETLKRNCPCAHCREKRGETGHSEPLTPRKTMLRVIESSRDEELRLKKIWPVGQYAIGMEWGDGHQTGIYTFDYLRELAGLDLN